MRHFAISILLLLSLVLHADNSVVVIAFDEEIDGDSGVALGSIQEYFTDGLTNKGFEVIVVSKSDWDNEESIDDKRFFVESFGADFTLSVELMYKDLSDLLSIGFRNFGGDGKRNKPIKAKQLRTYTTDEELHAVAIEWLRDFQHFVQTGEVGRPQTILYEVMVDESVDVLEVKELKEFLDSKLRIHYLNREVSECFKLKPETSAIGDYIRMDCNLNLENNNVLVITVIFDLPQDDADAALNALLEPEKLSDIPNDKAEYEAISLRLLDKIIWPDTLKCNE